MRNAARLVLCGVIFLLCFCDQNAIGRNQVTLPSCPVTSTVWARAPREPGVDPLVGPWYINADRSIWAMHTHTWQTGGEKVPWIRPAGAKLVMVVRRLDGPAPPLKVQIPGFYPTAFQATGMDFPTQGCWEVTAKAGGKLLRFVTKVVAKQNARK
jgi:hypothetical protein